MHPRCPLCRSAVLPSERVLLKAGRTPLATVHPQCAHVAQRGVALFGKLALMGAGQVLQARAPNAMLALKTVQQLLSQKAIP